jgi:hypothetical protein
MKTAREFRLAWVRSEFPSAVVTENHFKTLDPSFEAAIAQGKYEGMMESADIVTPAWKNSDIVDFSKDLLLKRRKAIETAAQKIKP